MVLFTHRQTLIYSTLLTAFTANKIIFFPIHKSAAANWKHWLCFCFFRKHIHEPECTTPARRNPQMKKYSYNSVVVNQSHFNWFLSSSKNCIDTEKCKNYFVLWRDIIYKAWAPISLSNYMKIKVFFTLTAAIILNQSWVEQEYKANACWEV